MSPQMRRWMPVVVPFVAGVLGYLLLGDGPHAGQARATGDQAWVLPEAAAPATEAARAVWVARSPWGQESGPQEAAPDALALSPVGIVVASGKAVALFARADGQVVRASLGDALPDGSQITGLDATGVAWSDALGRVQRRTWLVDVVAAPVEEVATPARGRGQAAGAGAGARGLRGNRPDRPAGSRSGRDRGQPGAAATVTTPTQAGPRASGPRSAGVTTTSGGTTGAGSGATTTTFTTAAPAASTTPSSPAPANATSTSSPSTRTTSTNTTSTNTTSENTSSTSDTSSTRRGPPRG